MTSSPPEASAGTAAAPHARGDRATVVTRAMVHGGACLAHLDDGTTVFVDGAIPDETVEVELRHRKGRVWFAGVVGVASASPDRVEAPCPYYGACGGCQLQHVAYDRQLALKEGIVRDAMRRQHVALPESVATTGMEEPWRYRWRGEFHVVPGARGFGDAALGFNRMRSWRPVAVEDCLIHHPRITGSLAALRETVRQSAQPGLTALHLTAGEDGSELLLRARPPRSLPAAAIDARALADSLRWSTTSTSLHWRGLSFRVSPDTFIQVNWGQLEALYGAALRALGNPSGTVIDAYAGIGVLACELASHGTEVVCIESNRDSARMGVLNARLNDCEARVRYIAEPVEDALAAAAAGAAAVVLDPPRAGCDPQVSGWLALAGPPRIVYVSCDPATMARDLRTLTVSGPYTIESFEIVDMFPQTHHVECVAGLRREGWQGDEKRRRC